MFCRNCGAQTDEGAQFCIRCGANLRDAPEALTDTPPETQPPPPPPPGATPYEQGVPPPGSPAGGPWAPPGAAKSKLAAGLLGIFLGAFGVHRFYLGYTSIGVIQLVLGAGGIVTCGVTTIAAAIWGLIEGIMILTGSIATDANGVPLVD